MLLNRDHYKNSKCIEINYLQNIFFVLESSNSGSTVIHNRRPSTFRMEEERHRCTLPHQRQREEVILLPDILPVPEVHDMGT